MRWCGWIMILALGWAGTTCALDMQSIVDTSLKGLEIRASKSPYSKTISRIYIGYDKEGRPKKGLAYREIKSFKPITGVVIVEQTTNGYVLQKSFFPDLNKIRKAKDRKQIEKLLESFQNVAFDPHGERSAVDGLTGATRYGLQTSGYLNYLARKTALEMEAAPDWPKLKGR